MPAGFTSITGTKFQNASGAPLANGRMICWPVNNQSQPVSATAGGGGLIAVTPVTFLIVAGEITTDSAGNPPQLADTTLTTPPNIGYKVQVIDASNNVEIQGPGYNCVQPSGSAWSFDTYTPIQPALVTVQPGPAGASAYQAWLALGNTGTQAQFVASLKGAAGTPGASSFSPGSFAAAVLPLISNGFDPAKTVANTSQDISGSINTGATGNSTSGLIPAFGATGMVSNLPLLVQGGGNAGSIGLYDSSDAFIGYLAEYGPGYSAGNLPSSLVSNHMIPAGEVVPLPGTQAYVKVTTLNSQYGQGNYASSPATGMVITGGPSVALPSTYQPYGYVNSAQLTAGVTQQLAQYAQTVQPQSDNQFDYLGVTSNVVLAYDGTINARAGTNTTGLIPAFGATALISDLPLFVLGGNTSGGVIGLYNNAGAFIGFLAEYGPGFSAGNIPAASLNNHLVLPNVQIALPGTQSYIRVSYNPAQLTPPWVTSAKYGMLFVGDSTVSLPPNASVGAPVVASSVALLAPTYAHVQRPNSATVSNTRGLGIGLWGDSITALVNPGYQPVLAARTGSPIVFQDARSGRYTYQAFECYGTHTPGATPGNNVGGGTSDDGFGQFGNSGTVGHTLTQDITSVKIMLVWLGTNDQNYNPPASFNVSVGALGDPVTAGTMYGNWRWIQETLQAANPNMRLMFVTPYFNNRNNDMGASVPPVVNAIVAFGASVGIPVLNAYQTFGVNAKNYTTMLRDGIHPSDAMFANVVGPALASFVQFWN